MNVGIGTVAAPFLFWEHLFRIWRYCVFAVWYKPHVFYMMCYGEQMNDIAS
jgi:hypothetical protein